MVLNKYKFYLLNKCILIWKYLNCTPKTINVFMIKKNSSVVNQSQRVKRNKTRTRPLLIIISKKPKMKSCKNTLDEKYNYEILG